MLPLLLPPLLLLLPLQLPKLQLPKLLLLLILSAAATPTSIGADGAALATDIAPDITATVCLCREEISTVASLGTSQHENLVHLRQ